MSDVINLRKNASSLKVSPEFDTYSSVEVILAKEGNTNKVVTVGDNKGRKLTVEMTQCSDTDQAEESAIRLLNRLQSSSFQYRPYEAEDCLLDPSAEIGDAVSINGTYSGIYNKEVTFTPLMKTKLTAPQDEALDHEYAVKTSSNKTLTREMGYAYSQMAINANAIRAEVRRAEESEGELLSAINQTAEQISAKVDSSKSGSFGWNLTSDKWEVVGNGSTVFSVTSSGAEVVGKITATSGRIGGFEVGDNSLYNNISSMSSTLTTGVYLGTDGIKIGSNFKVNSSGIIEANGAKLSGTLTVGGSAITAASLKSGADSGNRIGSGMSGYGTKTSRFECSYFNVTGQLVANAIYTSEIQSDKSDAFIYFKGASSEIESAMVGAKTIKYGKSGSSYANKLVGRATVTIDGTEYTFATASGA